VNCSERVDAAIWIRVGADATFPGVKPVATLNCRERVIPRSGLGYRRMLRFLA